MPPTRPRFSLSSGLPTLDLVTRGGGRGFHRALGTRGGPEAVPLRQGTPGTQWVAVASLHGADQGAAGARRNSCRLALRRRSSLRETWGFPSPPANGKPSAFGWNHSADLPASYSPGNPHLPRPEPGSAPPPGAGEPGRPCVGEKVPSRGGRALLQRRRASRGAPMPLPFSQME